VREHLTISSSAIYRHKTDCPTTQWEISTLARGKDLVDLRIKENTLINLLKPELNNKEDTKPYHLL
jgi:hypothetical protein